MVFTSGRIGTHMCAFTHYASKKYSVGICHGVVERICMDLNFGTPKLCSHKAMEFIVEKYEKNWIVKGRT